MKAIDKQDYINRYENRLKEFGYDPQTLGWGKVARQDVRFGILASKALKNNTSSILDIGCGFADLFEYLRNNGWKGKYTGVDIVPGLLQEAKKRHPELNLILADITEDKIKIETHDYVIASGVMNATLPSNENENHIKRMLSSMYNLAKIAVCVDFMSSLVDFKKEGAWHMNPSKAIEFCVDLTNCFELKHNYMRFEFSIFLYKNNEISERKIFKSHEELLNKKNTL